MARAHVMRPITGENGDILYGARVLVREAGLSVRIRQPLYAGPIGDEQLSNPHVSASGLIDFWLEEPQRVSVLVQSERHSDVLVYLDAAVPPEETARTASPLLITGEQAPGHVLLAGGQAGEAVWGVPPVSSGVTPQVSVLSETFTRGQDPAGWTILQAPTSTRDYPASVPPGQGLSRSLHAAHTKDAGSLSLTSPGFTLNEPGFISLWLRPSLATGEKVVIAATTQGGTKTILETITTTREWGIYRYPLVAGTYQSVSVEFTGAAVFTGSTGHEMWVTDIRAVYGGQVPAHSHPGTGTGSVLLGTGGEATGVNAIAIGATATASGTDSVALGRAAQASGISAVAAGLEAQAPADNTIAVGAHAKGTLANTGWTAVGVDAYADGADSMAIGATAKAYGARSTAIGAASYTASAASSAVAIGAEAQALASAAVALGKGAVVAAGHDNSVALGSGATTTAAGQIMLGDSSQPSRSVVVAGRLTASSAATVGASGTTLGFYGATGVPKPVVAGSDGGVTALRALIAALASLGLITNNTTS